MENRKPAAEIMKLSHCFEGRLHVQCGDFWKDLHNEIKVKFHTLPGNTASHECGYSWSNGVEVFCFGVANCVGKES